MSKPEVNVDTVLCLIILSVTNQYSNVGIDLENMNNKMEH